MILVTGLTGLLGSGFFHFLRENPTYKKQIVALCIPSSDTTHLEDYCIIERGDSFDKDNLDKICVKYKFDMIIHISNKFQIPQFAELAVKHNIKKVIMISSTYGLTIGDVQNNEMMDKENYAISLFEPLGIEYIFLRPTAMYGTRPDGVKDRNMSEFARYIRKFPLFPLFGGGKATISPAWGREVGQALYICLTEFDTLKNKRLVASGDSIMIFKEMIKTLGNSMNRKVHFIYFPKWLGKCVFYSLYYLTFKKKDFREKIDRLVEDRGFDSSTELINLGYKTSPLKENLVNDKVL